MSEQAQQYRAIYHQQGRLDHVSEIHVSEAEAWSHLNTSRALHVLTGWLVRECPCGAGFIALKGDIRRSEHIERVYAVEVENDIEAIESLALALGLLAPASSRQLEVVS